MSRKVSIRLPWGQSGVTLDSVSLARILHEFSSRSGVDALRYKVSRPRAPANVLDGTLRRPRECNAVDAGIPPLLNDENRSLNKN
jgi:hypothetical protein